MDRRTFLIRSLGLTAGLALSRYSSAAGPSGDTSLHVPVAQKSAHGAGTPHAVVLGAGVAGLSAARTLAEQGWTVDVFEKEPNPGGYCSTLDISGFTFDLGPHVFNRRIVKLVPFQPGDLDPANFRESFFLKGKLLKFPKDLMTEGFLLDTLLTLVKSPFQSGAITPSNLEQVARSTYGNQAYEQIFKPLLEKWCSTPIDRLDARYLASRLAVKVNFRNAWSFAKSYSYNLLKTPSKPRKEAGSDGSPGTPARIPKAGAYAGKIGARIVCDRLAQAPPEIKIHCKSPVRSVVIENGAVTTVEAGAHVAHPDYVISTIPLNELARRVVGASTLSPLQDLEYLNIVFVFVRLARPRLLKGKWTWFPEPYIPFYRMSEMTALNRRHAPRGTTGLCLEVAIPERDPTFLLPAEHWTRLARHWLSRCFGVTSAEIMGVDVVKGRAAYPRFSRKNTSRIAQVVTRPYKAYEKGHRFETGVSNLSLAGRAGTFVYLLTPASIVSGRAAARRAMQFLKQGNGADRRAARFSTAQMDSRV